jgi:uncharacterized DUF497 family protein
LIEIPDDRFVYGEDRIVSFGELDGRAVAIVWTGRGWQSRINAELRKALKLDG